MPLSSTVHCGPDGGCQPVWRCGLLFDEWLFFSRLAEKELQRKSLEDSLSAERSSGAVRETNMQVRSHLHFTSWAFSSRLSTATYNKYICQEKEKQPCISVGIVRMFIEPRAKH